MSRILAKLYAHHRLIIALSMLALAACKSGDDHSPCG
jgi:hypothetical protein